MTDLDKLIAAVEAGTATDFRALLTDSDNPAERAKRCGWASSAYKGSLDAALRLHEALLPGWDYSVGAGPIQGSEGFACLTGWQKGEVDAESTNPARAWLLAILRALAALPPPPGGDDEEEG